VAFKETAVTGRTGIVLSPRRNEFWFNRNRQALVITSFSNTFLTGLRLLSSEPNSPSAPYQFQDVSRLWLIPHLYAHPFVYDIDLPYSALDFW
jgi:hypothetical protein